MRDTSTPYPYQILTSGKHLYFTDVILDLDGNIQIFVDSFPIKAMFIMLNASCWTILSVITRQQSTSSRGGVHSAALPRYQGGSRGEACVKLRPDACILVSAFESFGLWVQRMQMEKQCADVGHLLIHAPCSPGPGQCHNLNQCIKMTLSSVSPITVPSVSTILPSCKF